MKNVGLSLINFGPGWALPRSSIQLIHEVAFMPTQTTTSHGCVPCAGIALLQACFNCELTVWPVGFVESGGQRANSPDSPCHIYGYNINEIRDHYLMNYVGLISGGSVCKDGLLPPRFAPCSGEKCKRSKRNCDHGEWRTIPLYTKTPLPFAPFGSFLLYSLRLRCFWHPLPLALPASRLSRMPEISSTNPFPAFHQNIEETELG
jgi:hypothetical protein